MYSYEVFFSVWIVIAFDTDAVDWDKRNEKKKDILWMESCDEIEMKFAIKSGKISTISLENMYWK